MARKWWCLAVAALVLGGLVAGTRVEGSEPGRPAQDTPAPPTAAPPVATCVATPRPGGLYPDLVVWPPQWTLAGEGCPNLDGPWVLRLYVENLGNAPAGGFWVRVDGCMAVPVQARIPELVNGDRVMVDFPHFGAGESCRVLADAACEVPDRYRADNYWEGPVPMPSAPPTCTATAATPTPTETAAPVTPSATVQPRFSVGLPWVQPGR